MKQLMTKEKIYSIKIKDRLLIFGVFTSYLRKLPTASAGGPYPVSQVFVNVFLQPLK